MRIRICAVGRIRAGPERALIDDYLSRFDRIGRPLSLGPVTEHEIETRKTAGPEAEADALAKSVPDGALIVALDERGGTWSSPDLARRIAAWRDEGRGEAAFLIGGAAGLAPRIRRQAAATLSFGPMVWPHMLVRAMLAEQLYRAAAILAGSPYHRA